MKILVTKYTNALTELNRRIKFGEDRGNGIQG
jgi:hypothetical protein